MRVESIEIHVGEPDFPFTPVRQLEAKCEAATAFSGAPTMDEMNAKLREMAAGLGANAVVRVQYKTGASMTSWRSMRGTGLAVKKLSDEVQCAVCAETIKRAALKCRFCGTPRAADVHDASPPSNRAVASASGHATAAEMQEPLRSTNNPQLWIVAGIALFALLTILGSL